MKLWRGYSATYGIDSFNIDFRLPGKFVIPSRAKRARTQDEVQIRERIDAKARTCGASKCF
ncbi:unnamed protein product, partial [Nesidiocoris tenuis]